MPTFATAGPVTAIVEVAGAQVRVNASDRTDTAVRVEPLNPASRTDVKVAERTKVDFNAGHLTVKTTVPGDKNGSVAITIDLPAGSALTAYLAYSALHADGPAGPCDLHMASGQARLDRISALRANIAAGDVTVGIITGSADIDGGAFTMQIGQVHGPAVIASTGGQARIGHAAVGLQLTTSGGSLDIDRADATITATTATGNIRIGQLTHGPAELITGSGNIDVGITDAITTHLDLNSERGSVHNTLTPPAAPDMDATVTVHARTRHGDITIHPVAR
jgi:hypothetical protein